MPCALKTRFAPSPTGALHLGNARTALWSALLALRAGGCFLLRIEDTDAERSRAGHETALLADLAWLGLSWQEGPDMGGAAGPYRQSERGALYREYAGRLRALDCAYPCFCSGEQLAAARRAALAAGRPPRYPGTCAQLDAAEIEARRAAGAPHSLRFRVPQNRRVEFDDLVRGPQRFDAADIGDFVLLRSDGSAAFFFGNALDDALMGVTHVLRGEDHAANTPRQLLVLEALGLTAPRYGHLPLVVDEHGAPLSKRAGALGLAELRARGFLPAALTNYLGRLGHTLADDALLSLPELAARFDLSQVSHSAARFDTTQMAHWQRRALDALDGAARWNWLAPAVAQHVPEAMRADFVRLVSGNILFPDEAVQWAQILFGAPPAPDAAARATIEQAGADFFRAAITLFDTAPAGADYLKTLRRETGKQGPDLFMPLRAALTGTMHGPPLVGMIDLLGPDAARRRLADAQARCRSEHA